MPKPVILDVDPGVDDALAILLALRSEELEVRALTVVNGNVPLSSGVDNALKVLELAGHSDIKTTRQFYLSVQSVDLDKARSLQAAILEGIPRTDLTDPKVTHLGQKRAFPGRVGCKKKTRTPWLNKG